VLISEEISDDLGNRISFYHPNVTSRGLFYFLLLWVQRKSLKLDNDIFISFLQIYSSLILFYFILFNPLNAKLNPICHLLALLGAHHILHVSGIRVEDNASISV